MRSDGRVQKQRKPIEITPGRKTLDSTVLALPERQKLDLLQRMRTVAVITAREGEWTFPSKNRGSMRAIRGVLENIADVVLELTVYQRVVVFLYERPISFPSTFHARVFAYAARGIDPEHEEELCSFVDRGKVFGGEGFDPECRVGSSCYLAEGGTHPIVRWIPSRRRFIHVQGWRTGDVLVIPLAIGQRSLGHIFVDDPRDGNRPTEESLHVLTEIASVAAVALQKAYILNGVTDRQRLLRFLTRNTIAGLAIAQAQCFCYVNDQVVALLGYSREELLMMRPCWQVVHHEDRKSILEITVSSHSGRSKIRGIRKDGSLIWLEIQSQPMLYKNQEAVLLKFLDISERVQSEALLKKRALRDPLTNLYNRHYFDDAIQAELKRSLRYERPFTLMMADLARFKQINDRLGHHKGDLVLRDLSRVIQSQLRESDWVVRYGGDEFLIVLPETGQQAETVAQRVRTAVDQWAAANLPDVPLRIDIGWATWTPEQRESITHLLQFADARMYEEKARKAESRWREG